MKIVITEKSLLAELDDLVNDLSLLSIPETPEEMLDRIVLVGRIVAQLESIKKQTMDALKTEMEQTSTTKVISDTTLAEVSYVEESSVEYFPADKLRSLAKINKQFESLLKRCTDTQYRKAHLRVKDLKK